MARLPSLPSLPRLRRRPDVAVVVPAHQVGAYLQECLDSVAAQRVFPGAEVVVVDDGSTDDTGRIADAFAAAHPQVRVVHQANAGPGPGAARNAGVALVRAPHVLFLDGDDVLPPGGLDVLLAAAHASGADLTVGRFETFPEHRSYPWDATYDALTAPLTAPIEDVGPLVHNAAPGNKLVAVRALRRLGLRFAEGIHHQDTTVTVPLVLQVPVLTVVPDVVLRYRVRAGSIMDAHFTRSQNFLDHLQVVEQLVALRPGLPERRQALLDAFLTRSMQGFVLRATELDAAVLPDFVERAARVYEQLPVEAFAGTRSLQHRLAYAALRRRDLAALGAAAEVVTTVHAVDGSLYAGPPGASPPDPLTRAGAVIAGLDALAVDGDELCASGTVRVKGVAPVDRLGVTVALRLKGSGVSVPATVVPLGDDRTSRWTARWPASALPDGAFAPRVVLETAGGGQVSAGTRSDVDVPPVHAGGRTWQVEARDGGGRLVVGSD